MPRPIVSPYLAAIAVCLPGLSLPAIANAATATYDGQAVRYIDESAANDALAVDLSTKEQRFDGDEIEGWRVTFLQYNPATAFGPGCRAGFVSTVCPIGVAPPAQVHVDLGGGDDTLEVTSGTLAPGTRAALLGGDGRDEIGKFQTWADIDAGPGDDLIRPDARYSVLDFPPEPTPGDVVRGGPGTDTVDYGNALTPISVSLDGMADDGRPGEGDNISDDVENVVGSAFGGTFVGSASDNVLEGGNGDGVLVGAGGRDTLKGGSGSETFDALDGAGGDRIECDAGADLVYADAEDLVAKPDCEKIVLAPRLPAKSLTYRSKRVAIRLSCPKPAPCRGKLRLAAGDDGKGTALGSASYSVKAGRSATVRLAPGSTGRKALGRSRKLSAVAFVSPTGRTAIAGKAVTVRR